jgi:hypothetical protein
MSVASRRTRGFKTERLLADYLKQWWGSATVGRGADPRGDVINVPFDVECKAVGKFSYLQWIKQSAARTAKSGKLGFIVWRCNGQGDRVHEYAALLPLADLVDLLLRAGYADMQGDMEQLTPMRCNMCGAWSFKETCNMCEKDPDANL